MKNKIKKIFVENEDGKLMNITDLPKEEYEKFLELMNILKKEYYNILKKGKKIKWTIPKFEYKAREFKAFFE